MIVLDAHVLIWWASGATEQLSLAAREAIGQEMACGQILVFSISACELAMLVAKGRLALSMNVAE